MDASLDTDIVIHLYKSGKKELLYSSFDKLYIYDFLLEKEMQRKSISRIDNVDVKFITQQYVSIGEDKYMGLRICIF